MSPAVKAAVLEVFNRLVQPRTDLRCKRKSVGCAIIGWAGSLLALEFNGPTTDVQCTNEVGNCGCAHAEPKAILKLSIEASALTNCTLVSTYSPCTTCANLIILSQRISTVVYDILTEHDKRGVGLLQAAGISVIRKADL